MSNIDELKAIADRLGCDVEKLKEEIERLKVQPIDTTALCKELEKKEILTNEEFNVYLKWRYPNCEITFYDLKHDMDTLVFLKNDGYETFYIKAKTLMTRGIEPYQLIKDHVEYWTDYHLNVNYDLNKRGRSEFRFNYDNADKFHESIRALQTHKMQLFFKDYYGKEQEV